MHEAYLRLFGLERISFHDRRHFFATAAMAMRILVDHARRNAARRRIPADAKVPLALAEEIGLDPVDGALDRPAAVAGATVAARSQRLLSVTQEMTTMLKEDTRVINKKCLNYVIGTDDRPLRFKPWIGAAPCASPRRCCGPSA